MAIDTGKILNIDIDEYLNSQMDFEKTDSRNYNLVGVHSHEGDISKFAALVPSEAEAVVNYQHIFFGTINRFVHHQIGVALIPKKK